MTAAIARIVISVASLEKALPLYEDVLDLRRARESPGIVGLALARGIELWLRDISRAPGAEEDRPDFQVADVDQAAAAATGVGAALIHPPAR